ncbi:hypothetical protein LguiA_002583 [Lonicera macranthoides]
MLIPTITLFDKLIFNPEIKPKNSTKFTNLRNLTSSPRRKNMVSSANCRCDILTLSLPTSNGSITLKSSALAIKRLRTSTTRIKRKGDKGSPCLKPLDALKLPSGLPLIITEKFTEFKHPPIHFLHLTPNPFLSNTKSKKSQST